MPVGGLVARRAYAVRRSPAARRAPARWPWPAAAVDPMLASPIRASADRAAVGLDRRGHRHDRPLVGDPHELLVVRRPSRSSFGHPDLGEQLVLARRRSRRGPRRSRPPATVRVAALARRSTSSASERQRSAPRRSPAGSACTSAPPNVPAVPDLRVGDLADRLVISRPQCSSGPSGSARIWWCGVIAPITTLSPSSTDAAAASRSCPRSTISSGALSRIRSTGSRLLPAGDHLGVVAVLGERRQRVLDRGRCDVVELWRGSLRLLHPCGRSGPRGRWTRRSAAPRHPSVGSAPPESPAWIAFHTRSGVHGIWMSLDPELAYGVDDRVDDRRGRGDGARLADALGAERVGRRRRRGVVDVEADRVGRGRHAGSRRTTPDTSVPESSCTASSHSAWAMPCTRPPCTWPGDDQRVDDVADVVDAGVLAHLHLRRSRCRPPSRTGACRAG